MKFPMPILEHFLAVCSAAGSEVHYVVRTPDGEETINMNVPWAEIHAAIRNLERLSEQRSIPDTAAGGLGRGPAA